MDLSASGERRNEILLLVGVAAVAAGPFAGLAIAILGFVFARRAGWVTVSNLCLGVVVVLAAFLIWAFLNGAGGYSVTSGGSGPILLD